jgi:hypothetical protein
MAADYGRNLYKQYEEELAKSEAFVLEIKALKQEKLSLRKDHESDIAAFRAEHKKEIKAISDKHEAVVNKLIAKIENLTEEVRKLRAQIDKNSSNSSKPPSSDGFKKPPKNIPNSREKTNRKPGGQKGHKGNIPVLFENPDETIDLRPPVCECGGKIDYEGNCPKRKQVIEITLNTHVREYSGEDGICAVCGRKHRIRFPKEAHNPVNIGADTKALAAMLNIEYGMPLGKIEQFVFDMTDGKVSLTNGSIVNACKELYGKVRPSIESIKDRLFLSKVMHKDETGVKINGKQQWIHTLTANDLAYYHCDENRGNEADRRMGVLAGYGKVLVHDHLVGLYAWDCIHAECNAHLLRYLIGVIENEPEYASYANEMTELLLDANTKRKETKLAGKKGFSDKVIQAYEEKYDNITARWKAAISDVLGKMKSRKKRYKREGEKLCPRLIAYKDNHLLFIRDFDVPFDNNLAERTLRGIKSKTKISGGFRTPGGGNVYATVRSYTETLRRQNRNIYRGITSAFAGVPVLF